MAIFEDSTIEKGSMTVQNQWMIYGASSVMGKKILNQALNLGYKPFLAGRQGQDLVELSIQTGVQCLIFNLDDRKKIQLFLQNISLIVLCETLSTSEHKRLLEACLEKKVHYIDMSSDLFSYETVLEKNSRFQSANLSAIPGLHPSVILSDFVAARLKDQLHDAISLSLACSESFTSILSLVNSLQRGGRVLQNGQLCKPDSTAETLLVPFNGTDTLTMASAQADILAAWQSTRIPNITFYRKAREQEVRLRRNAHNFRYLLHLPFIKQWVQSQDNFLIRHFGIKPFYPKKFAMWGKAKNASEQSLTIRMEIVNDFDLALDLVFLLLAKILAGDLRKGVLTASQALTPDCTLDSEHLSITVL